MNHLSTRLLGNDTHRSLLGSRGVTDWAAIAYSPYGWRQLAPRAPVPGFNGQRVERLTGAYLLGHGYRLYSPVLMRFHKPDTFSPFAQGGVNAYAYCQADPVNATDASGRFLDLIFEDLDPKYSGIISVASAVLVGTYNVALGIKTRHVDAPELSGWSKFATNTALVGSVTLATGGGLQIAGVKEGRYVSAFGALFTAAGAAMNLGQAVQYIAAQPHPFNYIREGLKRRFWFDQKTRAVKAQPRNVQVPPSTKSTNIRTSIVYITSARH